MDFNRTSQRIIPFYPDKHNVEWRTPFIPNEQCEYLYQAFPLPAGWQNCNTITYSVTDAAATLPPSVVPEQTYHLTGICTETTIVAPASPVCTIVPVTVTGTVASIAGFTGGTLRLEELAGDVYAEVASAGITAGVKTIDYTYTPAVAGTRSFRACYDGTGSNGNKTSNSEPVAVTAQVCTTCEADSFSFQTSDNLDVTFRYNAAAPVTNELVEFTCPQVNT